MLCHRKTWIWPSHLYFNAVCLHACRRWGYKWIHNPYSLQYTVQSNFMKIHNLTCTFISCVWVCILFCRLSYVTYSFYVHGWIFSLSLVMCWVVMWQPAGCVKLQHKRCDHTVLDFVWEAATNFLDSITVSWYKIYS